MTPPKLKASVAVLLLAVAAVAADKAGGRWAIEREQARQARKAIRQQAEADEAKRARDAAAQIAGLIGVAKETKVPGCRAELTRLIGGLKRMDPAAAQQLQADVEKITEGSDTEVTTADRTRWKQYLAEKRATLVKRPGELLNRTVKLGVVDLTYDFLREVLAFDPDQASIRRALGQAKVGEQWVTKFMAQQIAAGLVWDAKLGWVIARQKDRYDAGEQYDIPARRWGKLDELTRAHQNPAQPWVVQTEHFEVRGTTKLATVAGGADKLEAFYSQIFAVYASFFAKGGPADYKVILGLTEHPRLVVNILRTRDQFRAAVPESPDWAAGVWVPMRNASFFYIDEEGGRSDITRILYHEVTHQILDIFSRGNHSPNWLTEGIASFTEAAEVIDGELTVGRKLARKKSTLPLEQLLAVDTGEKWAKNPQYAAAGTLVHFCMEGEGRRFREDFVDYLRDNYRGSVAGRKLWDYLGVSQPEFEKLYEAFQKSG